MEIPEDGKSRIDMQTKSLIVFDMDGVLIDVSDSYRDTVRQTARLFFKGARAWEKLPDPLFSYADLAGVKQSGGLNNDWDLTFVVINLLYSLVTPPKIDSEADPWSRHPNTLSNCDVTELSGFLQSNPQPLSRLYADTGRVPEDFIANQYQNDVGSGNIIKQIFQEIYLGKDLFESVYKTSAKMYRGEGFIHREKLLIPQDFLENLSEHHLLAIATGRPRLEADFPLDHFGLRRYFTEICTHDDCITEEKKILEREGKKVSLSKPNPFMLDKIAAQMSPEVTRCYYVGDMPDDMVAAAKSKAKFVGIGALMAAPQKEDLRQALSKAGAKHIIKNFEQLSEIV